MTKKVCSEIYQQQGGEKTTMSFVISSSQRLASMENSIEVQQLEYGVTGFIVEHYSVGFGHPGSLTPKILSGVGTPYFFMQI